MSTAWGKWSLHSTRHWWDHTWNQVLGSSVQERHGAMGWEYCKGPLRGTSEPNIRGEKRLFSLEKKRLGGGEISSMYINICLNIRKYFECRISVDNMMHLHKQLQKLKQCLQLWSVTMHSGHSIFNQFVNRCFLATHIFFR